MKIEQWPIDRVKPYEKNPRQNDQAVDAVAASINHFGFRVPIVVDRHGVIIAGHTRLKAALKLGLAKVPVHVAADLSPEQARALRIADNKVGELATWDQQLLPLELTALKTAGFDMAGLGFDQTSLDRLLAPAAGEGLSDPDEVPPTPAKARTRPGDLWSLGDHLLLCGDSTKCESMATVMGLSLANLVLTDPPYGVEYEGKTVDALRIQNDGATGLEQLLRASLDLAVNATKPGAVWYVAAPAGPQFLAFARVLTDLQVWRQTLVWVKDTMVLGHSDYHYRHEAIFYGWTGGGRRRLLPDRTRTSVLEFPRPKVSREHPTMKPVTLWCELIANSTDLGDLIYEPFSGSGTTIIAATKLQRRVRAIELDPLYVDVAVRRWERYTGQRAELVKSGRPKKKTPAKAGAGRKR